MNGPKPEEGDQEPKEAPMNGPKPEEGTTNDPIPGEARTSDHMPEEATTIGPNQEEIQRPVETKTADEYTSSESKPGFFSNAVGWIADKFSSRKFIKDPTASEWKYPYQCFGDFGGDKFPSNDIALKVFESNLDRLRNPSVKDIITIEAVNEIAKLLSNLSFSYKKQPLKKQVAEAVAKNCALKGLPCRVLSEWLTTHQKLEWFVPEDLHLLDSNIGELIKDLKALPALKARVLRVIETSLAVHKLNSQEAVKFVQDLMQVRVTGSVECYEALEKIVVNIFENDTSCKRVAELRQLFPVDASAHWTKGLQKIAALVDKRGLYREVEDNDVSYDRLEEWYKLQPGVGDERFVLPHALEPHHNTVMLLTKPAEQLKDVPIRILFSSGVDIRKWKWDKVQALVGLRQQRVHFTVENIASQFERMIAQLRQVYAHVTAMFRSHTANNTTKRWWTNFPLKDILDKDYVKDWSDFDKRKCFWFPSVFGDYREVGTGSASLDNALQMLQKLEAIGTLFVQYGKLKLEHFQPGLRQGLGALDELVRLNPITVEEAYDLKTKDNGERLVNAAGSSRPPQRDPDPAVFKPSNTLDSGTPCEVLEWVDKTLVPVVRGALRDVLRRLEMDPRSDPTVAFLWTIEDGSFRQQPLAHFVEGVRNNLLQHKSKLTEPTFRFLVKWFSCPALRSFMRELTEHQVLFLPEYARQHAMLGTRSEVVDHFCRLYHLSSSIPERPGSFADLLQKLPVISDDHSFALSVDISSNNCEVIRDLVKFSSSQQGSNIEQQVNCIASPAAVVKLSAIVTQGNEGLIERVLREKFAMTVQRADTYRSFTWEDLESVASTARMLPLPACSPRRPAGGAASSGSPAQKFIDFDVKFIALKRLLLRVLHVAHKHINWFDGVLHDKNPMTTSIAFSISKEALSVEVHLGKVTVAALNDAFAFVERLEKSWEKSLVLLRQSSRAAPLFSDSELLFLQKLMSVSTPTVEGKEILRRLLQSTVGTRTLDEQWFDRIRRTTAEVGHALNEATAHMFAPLPNPVPTTTTVRVLLPSQPAPVVRVPAGRDVFDCILHNHVTTQPVVRVDQPVEDVKSLLRLHLLSAADAQFQSSLDRMIVLAGAQTVAPMSFHVVFPAVCSGTEEADALVQLQSKLRHFPPMHGWFTYVLEGAHINRLAAVCLRRGCAIAAWQQPPSEEYASRVDELMKASNTKVASGLPRSGKTYSIKEAYPQSRSIVLGKSEGTEDLCAGTSKPLTYGLHVEVGCAAEEMPLVLFRFLVLRRLRTGYGPVAVIEAEAPLLVEVTTDIAGEQLVPPFLNKFRAFPAPTPPPFVERALALVTKVDEVELFSTAAPLKLEVLDKFCESVKKRCPLVVDGNDEVNKGLLRAAVKSAYFMATPNAVCSLSRKCAAMSDEEATKLSGAVAPDFFFCLRNIDNTPYIAVMSESARHGVHLMGIEERFIFKAYECFVDGSDEGGDPDDQGDSNRLTGEARLAEFVSEVFAGATLQRVRDARIVFTRQVFEALLRINTALDFRCCPVIVVGETGCGKTYNFTTLAAIKGTICPTFEANAGTTPQHLRRFFQERSRSTQQQLYFIDEFNTSSACDHVKKLIVPDKGSAATNAANSVVAGACNPFRRVKGPNGDSQRLVYAVQAHVPATIKQLAWKFETHRAGEDFGIIKRIARKGVVRGAEGLSEEGSNQLARYVATGRTVLDKHMKDLPVSFRTTSRVVRLVQEFRWIHERVPLFAQTDDMELETRFVRLAVAAVFYAPLPQEVNMEVDGTIESTYPRKEFEDSAPDCVGALKASMAHFRTLIGAFIWPHLIVNDALTETLLVVFLSVATRTPLLLLGPPGTSKSLSLFLLLKVWSASDGPFRKMPKVFPFTLQCSELTRGEHMTQLFERAQIFQNNNNNNSNDMSRGRDDAAAGVEFISIVFVDEIALANHARGNPLKVLNSWLDHEGDRAFPAVVSTSNFDIELSLVNRCNVLRRSPPSEEELKKLLSDHKVTITPTKHLEQLCKNIAASLGVLSTIPSNNKNAVGNAVGMRHVYSFLRDPIFVQDAEVDATKLQKLLWWYFGPAAQHLEHKILDEHTEHAALKWGVTKRWFQEPVRRDSRCFMFTCPSFSTFRVFLSYLEHLSRSHATDLPTTEIGPVRFCFGDMLRADEDMRGSLIHSITQAMQHKGLLVLVSCDLVFQNFLDVFNGHYEESNGIDLARVAVDGNSFHYAIHKECRMVILSLPPDQTQLQQKYFAAALNDRLQHGSARIDVVLNEMRAIRPDWCADPTALCFDEHMSSLPPSQPQTEALHEGAAEVLRNVLRQQCSAPDGLRNIVLGYQEGWLLDGSPSHQALQVLRLIHTQRFWLKSESVCHSISQRVNILRALHRIQDPRRFVESHGNAVLVTPATAVVETDEERQLHVEGGCISVEKVSECLGLKNPITLTVSHDTPDNLAVSQITFKAMEATERPLLLFVELNAMLVNSVGSFHLFALCELLARLASEPTASTRPRRVVVVALVPPNFEIVRVDLHPKFDYCIFYGPCVDESTVMRQCLQYEETCANNVVPQVARLFNTFKKPPHSHLLELSKRWEATQQPLWEAFIAAQLQAQCEKRCWTHQACLLAEQNTQVLFHVLGFDALHHTNIECYEKLVQRQDAPLWSEKAQQQLQREPQLLLMPPTHGNVPFQSIDELRKGNSPLALLMQAEFCWNGPAVKFLCDKFYNHTSSFLRMEFDGLFAIQLYFSIDNDTQVVAMVSSFLARSEPAARAATLDSFVRDSIKEACVSDQEEGDASRLCAFAHSIRLPLPSGVPGHPPCEELSLFLKALQMITCDAKGGELAPDQLRRARILVRAFCFSDQRDMDAGDTLNDALRDETIGQYLVALVYANPDHWMPLLEQHFTANNALQTQQLQPAEALLRAAIRLKSSTPARTPQSLPEGLWANLKKPWRETLGALARECCLLLRFVRNQFWATLVLQPQGAAPASDKHLPLNLFVDQLPKVVRDVLCKSGASPPPESGPGIANMPARVRAQDGFNRWVDAANDMIGQYNTLVDTFVGEMYADSPPTSQGPPEQIKLRLWQCLRTPLCNPAVDALAFAAAHFSAKDWPKTISKLVALSIHSVCRIHYVALADFYSHAADFYSHSSKRAAAAGSSPPRKHPIEEFDGVQPSGLLLNPSALEQWCSDPLPPEIAAELVENVAACRFIRSSSTDLLRFAFDAKDEAEIADNTVGKRIGIATAEHGASCPPRVSDIELEARLNELLEKLPMRCLLHVMRLLP